MKYFLIAIAALALGYKCPAQCAVTPVLQSEGSICLGLDTLLVNTPGTPSQITWYNAATVDTTVNVYIGRSFNAVTVGGGNGTGILANQLNFPDGVFVDPGGNVYVADTRNNRVQMFPAGSTSATNGITIAGGNGAGTAANQLDEPTGIYVDAAGYLYVADGENCRIQKFPPGSTSATAGITIAGGNGFGLALNQMEPVALCFDAAGNLYVGDYGNERILEFPPGSTSTTSGTVVAGGNGQGAAANQFQGCYGLLVDNTGDIYVSDQGNARVLRFPPGSTSSTQGVTVAGGNGIGTAANQFEDPTSICMDSEGNLYVDDDLGFRVQEFPPGSTSATNGITIAGGQGYGDGPTQFNNSYGMYIDANTTVYLADAVNCRIQKFAAIPMIDRINVPTQPGTYTAVVKDSAGCVMITNAIVINPLPPSPALSIAANATSVCPGDTAIFIASATNGGTNPTYQWQINGENTGMNNDTLMTAALTTGDTINCILTSAIACTSPVASTEPVTMTVNALPVINFDPDTLTIAAGSSAPLNPTITGTVSSSQWLPVTSLDNPGIPDPMADPTQTTTYQLTVTSAAGCQASGKTTVVIYYPLSMPNAFTPNGDGKNDVFRIPSASPQQIERFSVYNRWGSCVFTTANSGGGWDGTVNGSPEPAGTYVWIIQYHDPLTGKAETANGTVILVR
jgi:gliding motility-associated-like protein